jgi:hypothetical protein
MFIDMSINNARRALSAHLRQPLRRLKKPHILFIPPKIGLSKPALLHCRYASGRLEEFLERVGFSLVKELSPSEPIQTAKDRTTGYSSSVELLPWS